MAILQLSEIVKTYGKQIAVDHVTFDVAEGSIFGLLGPNGAGKTSLIRIITTITKADEGTVRFNGELLNNRHPEQIGYLPEERGLYRKMKVGEHLLYLAQLKGLSLEQAKKEIHNWLDKFGIQDWWNKKIEELSKGMQQKIQFIATVVHRPNLIILDEPFSGLDPINTNLIKEEIRQLNREGTGIIFSTHRMEQVEEICKDIVLINKGRNVLEGEVREIKNRFKENIFRVDFEGEPPAELPEYISIVGRYDQSITLQVPEGTPSNRILRNFLDRGSQVTAFNEILPTLNEIFIRQVELS